MEADENDHTFLSLHPEVAVVTSVESDHLENYQDSPAALAEAFEQFLASSRHRIVCADDPGAARLGAALGATTYGTDPDADFRMVDVSLGMPTSEFELWRWQPRRWES